jgi:hypothetical protein
VTTGAVQHQADPAAAHLPVELLQAELHPRLAHAWQHQEEALAGRRLDRGVQPQPLVPIVDDPGRA